MLGKCIKMVNLKNILKFKKWFSNSTNVYKKISSLKMVQQLHKLKQTILIIEKTFKYTI